MTKKFTFVAGILIVIFLIADTIPYSLVGYSRVINSLPGGIRQNYLDYVLDVKDGYFRSYWQKVHALRVLIDDYKKGSDNGRFDGHKLPYLLRSGVGEQDEPIPEFAMYLLLLMNERDSYHAVFEMYKNDNQTLEDFRMYLWEFKEFEPSRFNEVLDALNGVDNLPTGFTRSTDLRRPRGAQLQKGVGVNKIM